MSDNLANSAIAQLLLGNLKSPGATSPPQGQKSPSSTVCDKPGDASKDNKNSRSDSSTPHKKRKRIEQEIEQSHVTDRSCDEAGNPTTRCPMCSFVGSSEEAIRTHLLYHRRVLAGMGKYTPSDWPSTRRRTISDSPVTRSSESYHSPREQESSLKDLLLGPRKPAVLASSYLRSIVASMAAKPGVVPFPGIKCENVTPFIHHPTIRDRCYSEGTALHRPGSAPADNTLTQTHQDHPQTEPARPQSDPARCTSTAPAPDGCVSPGSTGRWQDNQSPTRIDSWSADIPPTKKPRSRYSQNSTTSQVSASGQPMDLSSKQKVADYTQILNTASQCDLLKPEDIIQWQLPTTDPEVTSSSVAYRCPFCSITFEDEVLFSIHMGCHSHKDPFLCNVCGKKTINKYAFYTHIMRGHSSAF